MKETRADTRRALLQAMGLHVVLFALMFAGLQWTRSNVAEAARGEVIEADLVDPSALSAAMRSALQRDPQPLPQPQPVEPTVVEDQPPDPLPEPMLEDPVPPPPIQEPDQIDQDLVQRDADATEVAQVDREQEAKRRQQEQIDLDARERQRKLEDIRRQRESATRERSMAEQRAQQMADAKAQQPGTNARPPPPGNPAGRSSQSASYQVALMNAILRQWTRPESVEIGQVCQVLIRQIPGGEVVDVQVSPSCPYDELGRRSVEAAILKASPLPYAGFEDVFVRNPVLKFRAEDL